MTSSSSSRMARVRVVAQDPTVTAADGSILTGVVSFPIEDLDPGPTGPRLTVVDYDSSTGTLYAPAPADRDMAAERTDAEILGDPAFHAQNVYGLVMATVARFEMALGRRVAWGFPGHQLKIVPHAFEVANAFYSSADEALLLGHFPTERGRTFTCLSHDVVVHETAHALLDGLRPRFLKPSSPDQAAFHEGFSDVVALLSVFALPEVVRRLVERAAAEGAATAPVTADAAAPEGSVPKAWFTVESLTASALFALAEDMVRPGDPSRIGALRRSVALEPHRRILDRIEFRESHRRGEVFVAAMGRAFLAAWTARLQALGPGTDRIDLGRATEEGADIARLLLTVAIRGIDYTPPVHLHFGDFLSAALTVDAELRADDTRYDLRGCLRRAFAAYGIAPASAEDDGCWRRRDQPLQLAGVRFSSVQSDPTEMFRLIWANREQLHLPPSAYSWVSDLWPSQRVEPHDGLVVRETLATCIQYVKVTAEELPAFGLVAPPGMRPDTAVVLEGGTTLVLDEYGLLKYEITNRLPSPDRPSSVERAQRQVEHLFRSGAYERGATFRARLANLHRSRAAATAALAEGSW